MTIPYTYLIKCIITNEVYYGVRYAKDCTPSELWQTYFTSSNLVKDRILFFGKDSFKYEIRKIFKSAIAARKWEYKVLKRMKVLSNPVWLNRSYGLVFYDRKSRIGQKLVYVYSTKKYKFLDKIVADILVLTGVAEIRGPTRTIEQREKISKGLTGKKKSTMHINNIVQSHKSNPDNYGFAVYTNGENNMRVKSGDQIPDGYHLGSCIKGISVPNKNKNKTYEEIYGKERSKKIKTMRSKFLIDNNPGKNMKGKKYEDLYDLDTVNRLKESRRQIGKNNLKIYEVYQIDKLLFYGGRSEVNDFLYVTFGGSKSNNIYNSNWLMTHNIRLHIQYKNH